MTVTAKRRRDMERAAVIIRDMRARDGGPVAGHRREGSRRLDAGYIPALEYLAGRLEARLMRRRIIPGAVTIVKLPPEADGNVRWRITIEGEPV